MDGAVCHQEVSTAFVPTPEAGNIDGVGILKLGGDQAKFEADVLFAFVAAAIDPAPDQISRQTPFAVSNGLRSTVRNVSKTSAALRIENPFTVRNAGARVVGIS